MHVVHEEDCFVVVWKSDSKFCKNEKKNVKFEKKCCI